MGHRVIRGTAIFAAVFIVCDVLVATGLLIAAELIDGRERI